MAIRFTGSTESRPRGETAPVKPETIRDLADIVQAKEKNAKTGKRKVSTNIRLDPEVVTYFEAGGLGWQTRINAVLRNYVEQQIRG